MKSHSVNWKFWTVFGITVFLGLASALFSLSSRAKADLMKIENERDTTRTVNTKALRSARPVQVPEGPHLLAASYYNLNDNSSASLMLSNQKSHPIEIHPTLFSMSGTQIEVPSITLQGNTASELDLRQWAAVAGTEFNEGSLQILYNGKILEVGGLLVLKNAKRRLLFDEELSEVPKDFRSSRLEGIWWVPSKQSEINLAISNTSGAPLMTSITVGTDGGGSSVDVPLGPHESRVLNVKEVMRNESGALPRTGGVSISHNGARGALLAHGMVQDPNSGYSSVIEFSDPARAKTARFDGAGLRVGQNSAEELSPVAVVRNLGSNPTIVSGRIPYTLSDGATGVIQLPDTHLGPGKIKDLDLAKFIKVAKLEKEIASAGLEFTYDSQPGSVIVSAQSVSSTLSRVFRLPMKDAGIQSSSTGQYPWSITPLSSTVVYVKNVTDEPQKYTMYVLYNGGKYSLGLNTLEAGQSVAIDVRKVRDSQKPDASGTKIPLTATKGQVHWSMQGDKQYVLIGRLEQLDTATGKSMTAACGLCCPDSFSSSWLDPVSVIGHITNTQQFTYFRQDADCGGTLLPPYNVNTSAWDCDDHSVATIDSFGLGTAQGLGYTNVFMAGLANIYTYVGIPDEEYCDSSLVDATANADCDVTPEPPCDVPVSFKQTNFEDIGNGNLRIHYVWESSNGDLELLNNCTISEKVDYPGLNPFSWPSPPYVAGTSPNPTVTTLPATSGAFFDDHLHKSFLRPYSENHFNATQIYQYTCPCANSGNPVRLLGPMTIARGVTQNLSGGTWRYDVTKSGAHAVLNPLP